jgi:hypothetical protein
VLNGSFETAPNPVRWVYGGELPVGLTTDAIHGLQAARLGEPSPAGSKWEGRAWLRQTFYIPPSWERPTLTFRYRMVANDSIYFSDFYAWLATSRGEWLTEIVHDGFRSCFLPLRAPPPGYDLGWRSVSYDLSAYKGQPVRLIFENRNLHSGYSMGIWTTVDDVRVIDAGPAPTPPGPHRAYVPVLFCVTCDLITSQAGSHQ